MSPAPIALFAYNRPLHLRHAVEALQRNPLAAASELHVFSDGPRTSQAEGAVAEVRAYAALISGFGKLVLHNRDRNLGLAGSVIDGVTRLCDEHGSSIVVEDDLVVAPPFLAYMNAAIDRYRDDSRVMQISGHMFPVEVDTPHDAFFLPFISSWGWATWDRAWRLFDGAGTGYPVLKADAARRNAFEMNGAFGYFSMLEAQLQGKSDSWAILWNLSVFMHQGLVLYPRKTLVQNGGFDGSGVHCRGNPLDGEIDAAFHPTDMPPVGLLPGLRDEVYNYFRVRNGLPARIRNLVARFMP